jgi:hypothetical protein
MSTEHTRKCNRVDRRMAQARKLLDMWLENRLDNRQYVLRTIGGNIRLLAALAYVAQPECWDDAVDICERIARERTP